MRKKWKPRKNQLYWYISPAMEVCKIKWAYDGYDILYSYMGNCFKTEKEAVNVLERIRGAR